MKIALVIAAILALNGVFYYRHLQSVKVQPISISATSATDYAPKFTALTVIIKSKSSFEVDGVLLDLEQLNTLLSAKKWNEHTELRIKRGASASYEDTIPIMDLSRQIGISRLSIE